MEESRTAFKIVTVKPTGKRSLGRFRCRWEDNVRKYLKETGINRRNWVDSARGRDYKGAVVNVVMNLRVHKPLSLLVNLLCS